MTPSRKLVGRSTSITVIDPKARPNQGLTREWTPQ